ncbi:MAG: radical SAM protein [Desulfurococcaceae archaeon]
MPGLDPFKITELVEKQVVRRTSRGCERRYYRFRGGRWYGGIATGDVVGCNLRCKFCWSWRYSYYSDKGWFEAPFSVFEKLTSIAGRSRYRYLRLSGGEPTIGFEHLIELLNLVEETKYVFILETNGLLIGKDPGLARRLAEYSKLVVRVSFKGCTPSEFEYLTGARAEFYEYQFRALENLLKAGLKPCEELYPAVMLSFSTEESYVSFKKKLAEIHPSFTECIDEEYVILYPHVRELLEKNKLKPRIAYDPSGIPEFMI